MPHLQKRQDDDPIRKLEEQLIGKKNPGFFPTPKPIISRMLELADIQPGERVLEPSAGKGDILDMLRDHHSDAGEIRGIEFNGMVDRQTERVGNRRVEVGHPNTLVDDLFASLVGLAVLDATLDAAARELAG